MINHILVPLDGSHLAEASLPAAARIASATGSFVTLVHVIEKGAREQIHGDRHLVTEEDASEYLRAVAARRIFASIRVETHVHTAQVTDVAKSIAEHCEEMSPDLIVMSVHGKRDARKLILGTLAQQVIGLGKTPVLIVKPTATGHAFSEAGWEEAPLILAPVDGNPAHEKGLPVVSELGSALHARVQLMMAVPKLRDLQGSDSAAALISPRAMRERLELNLRDAEQYMRTKAAELSDLGLSVSVETVRGNPAGAIVTQARRVHADIIVLGTHGKAGSEAFWSESVAARVVNRTETPMLLVPLREQ